MSFPGGNNSYLSVLTLVRETYRKTFKEENPDAKGIAAVRCLPMPTPFSFVHLAYVQHYLCPEDDIWNIYCTFTSF